MTKYSTDFKIKSVQKYFDGNISISSLSKELKLPNSTILRGWIYTARQQGLGALKVTNDTQTNIVSILRPKW